MGLYHKIRQNRKVILERCFNLIADTYPPATSSSLKQEKNRFLNPVGYNIKSGIENIFEELTGKMDLSRLIAALENIIKIRAVQGFSPSEAIGFIFILKNTVLQTVLDVDHSLYNKEYNTSEEKDVIVNEFIEFGQRIDKIVSMAFDIFIKCREKIYEIKIKDMKGAYGK